MDRKSIIQGMEQHAKDFGLSLQTVGQYAVKNRNIHERLVVGESVETRTLERIAEFLKTDRARREGQAA